MKKLLFFLLLFMPLSIFGQLPVNEFNNEEKQYMNTLLEVASFLKTRSTTTLTFHQAEYYTPEERLYDTIIAKFFEMDKMSKIFEVDTSHFAVEGKFDIVRHMLNACDYYLDIVPPDSIFVRPYRYNPNKAPIGDNQNRNDLYNIFEIYFLINNIEVAMMACQFDPTSKKVIGLTPASSPNDRTAILNFLKRQKGYYDFPNPWNRVLNTSN